MCISVYKSVFRWFIAKKNKEYSGLSTDEYRKIFISNHDVVHAENSLEKIKAALERAWQNRDFEINKFWSRATYYWAFIALIAGGYGALFVSDYTPSQEKEMLLLALNSFGLFFSTAWLLSILGSKFWQVNWEKHIDELEDYVTGPLCKTLFYSRNNYSVSKISEILAYVVIAIWAGLLYHLIKFNNLSWDKDTFTNPDLIVIFIISTLTFFEIILLFRYCRKKYDNKKEEFILRKPKQFLNSIK